MGGLTGGTGGLRPSVATELEIINTAEMIRSLRDRAIFYREGSGAR